MNKAGAHRLQACSFCNFTTSSWAGSRKHPTPMGRVRNVLKQLTLWQKLWTSCPACSHFLAPVLEMFECIWDIVVALQCAFYLQHEHRNFARKSLTESLGKKAQSLWKIQSYNSWGKQLSKWLPLVKTQCTLLGDSKFISWPLACLSPLPQIMDREVGR